MKTTIIKTIEQALKLTNTLLSAKDLLSNRLNHKEKGWIEVKLTKKCKEELINAVTDGLGGEDYTKAKVKAVLASSETPHKLLGYAFLCRARNSAKIRDKEPVICEYGMGDLSLKGLEDIRYKLLKSNK